MDDLERTRASIIGLAIGDALGHPTEFVSSLRAIRERFGALGVTDLMPSGRHPAGTFTDDTQMTICVARALVRAGHAPLDDLMKVLAEEFVAWSRSKDNTVRRVAPASRAAARSRRASAGATPAWRSRRAAAQRCAPPPSASTTQATSTR